MVKVPKIYWKKFNPSHPPHYLTSFRWYLVVIKETTKDGEWYHVDVAQPYGNTIDDFWEPMGDGWTDQATVTAWAAIPLNCPPEDLIKY